MLPRKRFSRRCGSAANRGPRTATERQPHAPRPAHRPPRARRSIRISRCASASAATSSPLAYNRWFRPLLFMSVGRAISQGRKVVTITLLSGWLRLLMLSLPPCVFRGRFSQPTPVNTLCRLALPMFGLPIRPITTPWVRAERSTLGAARTPGQAPGDCGRAPPRQMRIRAIPKVGGLHHRCQCLVAWFIPRPAHHWLRRGRYAVV